MDAKKMWARCGITVIDLAIHCILESGVRSLSEACEIRVFGSATRCSLKIRKLVDRLNVLRVSDNCLLTIRRALPLAVDRF